MSGTFVLLGGNEFCDGVTVDTEIFKTESGPVTVLATAAAYENPAGVTQRATTWFRALGVPTQSVPLLTRRDAHDPAVVDSLRKAAHIYITDGSPMHLVATLKATPALEAIGAAWRDGATLVGSGAGADVMGEHMVDLRGGAFTVGLGLAKGMAVIPHYDTWSPEKRDRTFQLAPPDLAVLGLPRQTAVCYQNDRGWWVSGPGNVEGFRGGRAIGLSDLPWIK